MVETVQRNEQGQDPSASVGGNPETWTEATGHRYVPIGDPLDDTGSASTPAPVVDVDQAGACNSTVCYQPNGTEILRSTRQPVIPDPPPSSNQQQSTASSKKGQGTSCSFICGGVRDGGLLAEGIAKAIGGLGVIAIAVRAITSPVINIFTTFTLNWIPTGAHWLLEGIQDIVNAFSAHNIWINVVIDLLKVLADVALIATTLVSSGKIIARMAGGKTFWQRLSFVAGEAVTLMKRGVTVFASHGNIIINILGPLTSLAIAPSLPGDIEQFHHDWQEAHNQ
jgi:hypothetical protein